MKHLANLFRVKIALMVGLASFAGTCLFSSQIGADHFYGLFSALFLAFGCSALNQYQEQERDGLMRRTSSRPLPGRYMKPKTVIIIAVAMILLSAGFILLTGNLSALAVVAMTVVGYNFIYTPSKSRTPFSVMIGSVTGSLPPVLGFCAAGGSLTDSRILVVTAVLYLWQTPHFALLSEKYSDDYKNAGFKTLKNIYGDAKSRLFINIWTAAYLAALFIVPLSGIYKNSSFAVMHIAVTVVFMLTFIVSYKVKNLNFHSLNISAVLFFLLITSDSLFSL